MTKWRRNTTCRQGSFLNRDTLDRFDLRLKDRPEKTVVVIASHDCDLPQSPEVEPYFEVIVGRYIDRLDGAFTHTKSPRKLHVELQVGEHAKPAEFIAADKIQILKKNLPEIIPDPDIYLSIYDLNIFRRWLGIRYSRSSFADGFNARLKDKAYKLDVKITRALKKHGNSITAIFFDVDDGEEITRTSPEDTYTLDITILYSTELDPNAAEAAANEAANEIIELFKTKLFDNINNTWEEIELRRCDVISDEGLSYKQSTLLRQWRMEHISLAEDPPHQIIESS